MAVIRKTITAENTISTKALAGVDRGEVRYDDVARTATITLVGVSQESAERAAKVGARHTRKEA